MELFFVLVFLIGVTYVTGFTRVPAAIKGRFAPPQQITAPIVLDASLIESRTTLLRAVGTREERRAFDDRVLDAWDEEFTNGILRETPTPWVYDESKDPLYQIEEADE